MFISMKERVVHHKKLQKGESWAMGKAVVSCLTFFLTTVNYVCETEFSAYTFESRTMIKYLQVWHEK